MKFTPQLPMPWDIAVFLTITTVGLGVSVQTFMEKEDRNTFRTPSSIESLQERPNGEMIQAKQTIDLGCIERHASSQRVHSEEGSIRFKGKVCDLSRKAMKRFEGVRVKNMTNGYEGTIFFQGYDSSFVTDFLVLQTGKNVIQVEWKDEANNQPRTVVADVYER